MSPVYTFICFEMISRLTGEQDDSHSDVADTCLLIAPTGVAGLLRCEVADALSCLMVAGSEELVSRVIRVKVQDGANLHFPVTVAMPFCARYRGNYRDVAMKIVDGERKASYVTPVTTEGTYGGQRVKFLLVTACFKDTNLYFIQLTEKWQEWFKSWFHKVT